MDEKTKKQKIKRHKEKKIKRQNDEKIKQQIQNYQRESLIF